MGQFAFLLDGLFGQDVALVSVFAFDLPRAGKRKTLFSSGDSFHLWHLFVIIII